MDSLELCIFSYVFLQIIHYIVSLRISYLMSKIWIRKEDNKSACRRLHLNTTTAYRSAVRLRIENNWYIILSLRMPFGGAPYPTEFALDVDLLADTINDLLEDDTWNEKEIFSDMAYKIPDSIPLSDDILFALARGMALDIPEDSCGKTDVYVDDFITVGSNIDNNLDRLNKAPITVIYAVVDTNSYMSISIPRIDTVAIDKMKAKESAEEMKICLGWMIDSRSLIASLPNRKTIGWIS